MKIALIFSICGMACGSALAEQFDFQVHRYCQIKLNTDKGKESVLIEVYPKAVPETKVVLKSALKLEEGVYKTPDGICFRLLKLASPIVNDPNRHINSGDWILFITGDGKSFSSFKTRMPAASSGEGFPELVYLGEKADEEK